jgi:hypothetical protein
MDLQQRLKNPKTMMRIGMAFLILASVSRWFLHPGAGISENWTDGITGFLYGVSIASLLVSVRRKAGQGARPLR